jgi:hypothetical protein
MGSELCQPRLGKKSASLKKTMGKRWEGGEARSGVSENDRHNDCEANDLGSRKDEDRGGTAGALGAGKGSEEGGVKHSTIRESRRFDGGFLSLPRNH